MDNDDIQSVNPLTDINEGIELSWKTPWSTHIKIKKHSPNPSFQYESLSLNGGVASKRKFNPNNSISEGA